MASETGIASSDGISQVTLLDMELDSECTPGLVCHNRAKSSQLQLYRYEEVPDFLKSNPFIKSGYRSMLPASLCVYSLFVWSNESLNVWTHLISFLVFFFLMLNEFHLYISQSHDNPYCDNFTIILGLVCYQICTFLSAAYHLLYCHSERACKRWFSLDLAGISVGILGCYIPGVYLAYYCHQMWLDVYMAIVVVLIVAVLGLQLHPRFLSPSWHNIRIALYSAVAGYGVLPASYWIYINGGLQAEIVQLFIGKVLGIYVLILLALVFYVTKIPERLLPGKVDYIGHSHQIWHILVVAAFLYWYQAGKTLLLYRLEKPCLY